MKKRLAIWGAIAALGVAVPAALLYREASRAAKVNIENCVTIRDDIAAGRPMTAAEVEALLGSPGREAPD
jgi:hypothetical protein